MTQLVKYLPASVGVTRDTGLTSGSRIFPGVGNGNPLQYSCLENFMDSGAWWTTNPWGCKESDTSKHLHNSRHTVCTQTFWWMHQEINGKFFFCLFNELNLGSNVIHYIMPQAQSNLRNPESSFVAFLHSPISASTHEVRIPNPIS